MKILKSPYSFDLVWETIALTTRSLIVDSGFLTPLLWGRLPPTLLTFPFSQVLSSLPTTALPPTPESMAWMYDYTTFNFFCFASSYSIWGHFGQHILFRGGGGAKMPYLVFSKLEMVWQWNLTHIEAISCQIKIKCEFSKWRIVLMTSAQHSVILENLPFFDIYYWRYFCK